MDAFSDVLGWMEKPVMYDLSVKRCKSCYEFKTLCVDCFGRYQAKLDYNRNRFTLCENVMSLGRRPLYKDCSLIWCYCVYPNKKYKKPD